MPAAQAASFTSGLLIGADVRTGLAGRADQEVIVMGRPELTELYAVALESLGRPSREYDGERAFIAGIKAIAGAMT
jgi:2-dehydro-3-deoxygalactonokinase